MHAYIVNANASGHILKKSDRDKSTPFFVSPAYFTMAGGSTRSLSLIENPDSNLPSDRSSIFFLRTAEAPPVSNTKNKSSLGLTIAINAMIKVIYRPKGVPQISNDSLSGKLYAIYNKHKHRITIKNKSPNVINAIRIMVNNDKKLSFAASIIMPKKSQRFSLTNDKVKSIRAIKSIKLTYVNDYGGDNVISVPLR